MNLANYRPTGDTYRSVWSGSPSVECPAKATSGWRHVDLCGGGGDGNVEGGGGVSLVPCSLKTFNGVERSLSFFCLIGGGGGGGGARGGISLFRCFLLGDLFPVTLGISLLLFVLVDFVYVVFCLFCFHFIVVSDTVLAITTVMKYKKYTFILLCNLTAAFLAL